MGRRLTSLTDGENEISYAYDASGQRISKTVNGVTTDFYYDDRGALILLSCEDGTGLYFYPEANGSIGSIGINGNRYYYVRNAQNDIIGITDKTGAFVARYTYDEWGVITSITDGNGNDVSTNPNHIANINPLRYRSYFYDSETGWYWLNTRYYNPEVGRFINADGLLDQESIVGNNLFTYCQNNPVNMADSTGELPFFLVTAAIGAVIGGFVAAQSGGNVLEGAIVGGLIGAGAGAVAGAAFAGSAVATTTQVALGVGELGSAIATGGAGAGVTYIVNNLQQAASSLERLASTSSDPINNALKQLDSSGLRPGQTEISRSTIMKLVNTFDPVKAQSCINSIGGTRYLVDGHHTTVASTILGKGTCVNMGMVTNQLPSATNIYWTKHWYEFWKTAIKIME